MNLCFLKRLPNTMWDLARPTLQLTVFGFFCFVAFLADQAISAVHSVQETLTNLSFLLIHFLFFFLFFFQNISASHPFVASPLWSCIPVNKQIHYMDFYNWTFVSMNPKETLKTYDFYWVCVWVPSPTQPSPTSHHDNALISLVTPQVCVSHLCEPPPHTHTSPHLCGSC